MNRRALLNAPNGPLLMPGLQRDYACVGPNEPASLVLTDFRTGPMITTAASASIEMALQQMKLSGARFAFVIDEHRKLVGSVTSYDIQGEKPIQYMQSIDGSRTTAAWRDVTVENIMEPVAQWQVLHHADVARLTIGEVASLMSEVGLRYLVVVELDQDKESWKVRGLFSGARIQILLGSAATGVAAAQTFAELEREIA
jgi:CBS-domain-containing membrane protein